MSERALDSEALRTSVDGLDDCRGFGRDVLEARLRWAVRTIRALEVNLTSVQERCTQLLEENRHLKNPDPDERF